MESTAKKQPLPHAQSWAVPTESSKDIPAGSGKGWLKFYFVVLLWNSWSLANVIDDQVCIWAGSIYELCRML